MARLTQAQRVLVEATIAALTDWPTNSYDGVMGRFSRLWKAQGLGYPPVLPEPAPLFKPDLEAMRALLG